MKTKRNSKGQFIRNEFKGLEIKEDRFYKNFGYTGIILLMIAIMIILVIAKDLGLIEVAKNGGV